MKKYFGFFGEVKSELQKVEWPKKEVVTRLTTIVLVVSLVVALFVGGLDLGFTNLLKLALTK